MLTGAEEQADVDFQMWRTYFQLALEGTASSLSTGEAIVRKADDIAIAAVKLQLKKRGG